MAKSTATGNLYFGITPHRPPSDEAVKAATERYREEEKSGKLKDLPRKAPTHQY